MTIKTMATTAPTSNNKSSPLKHLIVGGGITGVETALAFQDYDIPYVVFERNSCPGGVWDMSNQDYGSANEASAAQIDAVMFSPPGWYLDNDKHKLDLSDKLRGVYPSRKAVQDTTHERIKNGDIDIKYNQSVIDYKNNQDGSVTVTWEDNHSGERHVEQFAGVHFRTGHLNKMRATMLPGEETFVGEVKMGRFNDTAPYQKTFAGKDVVIVGWGAFAFECAVSALKHGAKTVHICSRSDKYHWFSYATYTASSFYSPDLAKPDHIPAVWDRIFDINEQAAAACGVTDILQNESTCSTIDGKRHFTISPGAFITCNGDPVMMGMAYGLVKYHRGEIAQVQEHGVVTTQGEEISCDVIIKCTGFKVDSGPVSGHAIHDSLFVDGMSNITCMNAIDGFAEESVFGPKSDAMKTLLVSIYALGDFNRAVAYFLQNPDKYEAFKATLAYSRVEDADSASYPLTMYLFNKFFAFGDEHIINNFMKSMAIKQEEYRKVLDEQTFLIYDKMRWDAWSNLFAERTGKPTLDYPFIDRMSRSVNKDENKSPN